MPTPANNYLPFPPRYVQTQATLSALTGQPERVYAALRALYTAQLNAFAQAHPDSTLLAGHPTAFTPNPAQPGAGLADADAHIREALYTTVVAGRSVLDAEDAAELMAVYELAQLSGRDTGETERRVGYFQISAHVLDQIAERWGVTHPARAWQLINKALTTGEVRVGQNSTKYLLRRDNGVHHVLHVVQDTVVTATNYRTGEARKPSLRERLFG